MPVHLPSTTALRALDAIARLGSVAAAATELNLTRGAVSHQIRTLEQCVGFVLTERDGRGISLTSEGKQYAHEVQNLLGRLREAAQRCQSERLAGLLTVSCNPGFASYWLCHHIGDFVRQFPEVSLHLIAPREIGDTSHSEADLFIAFGIGDWPGQWVEKLVGLSLFPVCSPRLLNQYGGLQSVQELCKVPLLHMNDHTDWRVWLASAAATEVDAESGLLFTDASWALSACIAAQGVCVGDNLISSTALQSGLLVRPFALAIDSPRSYWLVAHPHKAERPLVRAFCSWLKGKLAGLSG